MKKTTMLAVAVVPVLSLGALLQAQACDGTCCGAKTTATKTTVNKTVVKKTGTSKNNVAKAPVKKAQVKASAKKVAPQKVAASKPVVKKAEVPAVLNFKVKSLAEKDVDLSKYQGKVVMIVNVASKCGLTPQYQGLQELHKKYAAQGLSILGFPANDFGQQEPGSNEEISTFCQKNYGVEFDMFSKIAVNGEERAPLYKYLTSPETDPAFAGDITWNFEKFLIGRDGKIVARFAPAVTPTSEEVTKAIENELSKK